MTTKYPTLHDGKRKAKSNSTSISFLDSEGKYVPGRTEQKHKDDVDIHNIIRKYDKTGMILHIQKAIGVYGDYSEVNEFQVSQNMVIKAQSAFDALPSEIRKKFNNDPGQFFEFATDPKNKDEMITLGLANAPIVVDDSPINVNVVNTTPPPSA